MTDDTRERPALTVEAYREAREVVRRLRAVEHPGLPAERCVACQGALIIEDLLARLAASGPSAEMKLRQLLWLRHGCPLSALYGDDGEMQCGNCGLDFKRMTPQEIEAVWTPARLSTSVRGIHSGGSACDGLPEGPQMKPPRARCDCGRQHERFQLHGAWVTGCPVCLREGETGKAMEEVIKAVRQMFFGGPPAAPKGGEV